MEMPVAAFSLPEHFPEDVLPRSPLPIFKIHGDSGMGATPNSPAADIFDIAANRSSKRGRCLEKYLHCHNLIALGYGGADFWDVYPILYTQSRKSLVWVEHTSDDTLLVTSHEESFASLRTRTHIERLLAAWPSRYRVKTNTATFVDAIWRSVLAQAGAQIITPPQPTPAFGWTKAIAKWATYRGNALLVDLGFLLNAIGSELGRLAMTTYIKMPGADNNARALALACEGAVTNEVDADIASAGFHKAIGIARAANDDRLLAWVLIEQALWHAHFDSIERSITLLLDALRTATNAGYQEALAFCYANLGHQYARKCEYEVAKQYYTLAVQRFKAIGNAPGTAETLFNFAEQVFAPCSSQMDIDAALPLYCEALALFWGRELGQITKTVIYSRIIVILGLLHKGGCDVVTLIASNPLLQVSGVAEHMIHWVAEHGFESPPGPCQLEEWQHELSLRQGV